MNKATGNPHKALRLAKGSNTEILRSYVRLSPSLFLRLRMTRNAKQQERLFSGDKQRG